MMRWLRQNLVTLIISVIITSSFGYIITQTDSLKTNYAAFAISTTKEITVLQEQTQENCKQLDSHKKEADERWLRIEKKIDELIMTNRTGNDRLQKLTLEIKDISGGTRIDVKD